MRKIISMMCAVGLVCSSGFAFAEDHDHKTRSKSPDMENTQSGTTSPNSSARTGAVVNDPETRAGQNTDMDSRDMNSEQMPNPPNSNSAR